MESALGLRSMDDGDSRLLALTLLLLSPDRMVEERVLVPRVPTPEVSSSGSEYLPSIGTDLLCGMYTGILGKVTSLGIVTSFAALVWCLLCSLEEGKSLLALWSLGVRWDTSLQNRHWHTHCCLDISSGTPLLSDLKLLNTLAPGHAY